MLGGWIVFALGIPALLLRSRHQSRSGVDQRQQRLQLLFGLYLLVLFAVVLFPLRVDPGLRADDAVWNYASFLENWVNLTPFATVRQLLARTSATQAVRQLGGNLALLMPFGLLLPSLSAKMRRFIAFMTALLCASFGIELIQYLARIARLSLRSIDVDDVMLNVLGGLLGYLLWLAWSRFGSHLANGAALEVQRAED